MAWEVFSDNIGFATANYNGTKPTDAQLNNEGYTYTVYNQSAQRPTRGEYPCYTGNIGAVYNVPFYNQYAFDSRNYGLSVWDNSTGKNVGYFYNGNFDSKYLGFFINHETKQARVFTCGVSQRYNQSVYAVPPTQGQISASTIYQILMGAIIPEYNLTCLDNVKGVDSTLWLSGVKDEFTNQGDPVAEAPISNLKQLDPRSRITDIARASEYPKLICTVEDTEERLTELYIDIQGEDAEIYGYSKNKLVGDVETIHCPLASPIYDDNYLMFMVDEELEKATVSTLISQNALQIAYNFPETKEFLSDDIQSHLFYLMLMGRSTKEDPDDPYEDIPQRTGGGKGDRNYKSDPNANTPLPSAIACDLGFITLYTPTEEQLRNLASYMWTSDLFDIDNFRKIFADPMDCILGLQKFPFTIQVTGGGVLHVGNMNTGLTMYKVNNEFIDIPCGKADIEQQLNAFLDYSPYTKLEIYLPFCGRHALNVDFYVDKLVSLDYRVNVLTGGCTATLSDAKTHDVLDQFTGNVAYSIPLSATNYQNAINSLVQAGAGLVSGYVGAVAGVNLKPNIETKTANGGSTGATSDMRPYFIFTCPKRVTPSSANAIQGQPAYTTNRIGSLSGFCKVYKMHVSSSKATAQELAEIERLCKEGIEI